MRCRFAFSQTSDGRLLVTMEALWGFPAHQNGKFCVSAIDDENTFIQHVVLASLAREETIDLIASVLLAVSGRQAADRWISATLSAVQLTALGMQIESGDPPEPPAPPALGFVEEEDLARVFTQAPIPVCMMAGPEHIFTFVNPAYVRLVGRDDEEELLGKSVRDAFTDLEGQPFFALLDKVYRTGEPFVGVELPAKIRDEGHARLRELYFDFVYHPVRDRAGEVCGILCQATEVTERVLEKHVREAREEQLYRQWAELDAIYREAPFGMCLISAKDYSILRVNEIKAKLLGAPAESLIGQKMTDIYPNQKFIPDVYREVVSSKRVMNFELTATLPDNPGKPRTWFWNLNPVFGANGVVESIASIVLEVTNRPIAINAELESHVVVDSMV